MKNQLFVLLSFPFTVADKCVGAPCFNNGTCKSRRGGYSCLCPVEFYGEHCEKRKCDLWSIEMAELSVASYAELDWLVTQHLITMGSRNWVTIQKKGLYRKLSYQPCRNTVKIHRYKWRSDTGTPTVFVSGSHPCTSVCFSSRGAHENWYYWSPSV